MKFKVNSKSFLERLLAISDAISSNPILPILEDFYFSVTGDTLSVMCTDLETSVYMKMQVMGAVEDGKVAVPGKILINTLKLLPEQNIEISLTGSNLGVKIRTTQSQYKLMGEDPSSFPAFPELPDEEPISVPMQIFHDGFEATAFTVAPKDDPRVSLTGILIEANEEKLIFASSNAQRLAAYSISGPVINKSIRVVIPAKSSSIITGAIDKDASIKVLFSDKNIFFISEDITFSCRLIDAKYPEFVSKIPSKFKGNITIDRMSFLNALRRASIYANKSSNYVELSCDDKGNVIVKSVDSDFSNEAIEKIKAELDGSVVPVGLNAKLLTEALASLYSENVIISINTEKSQVLLRPFEDKPKAEHKIVIMPIVLQ